MVILIILKSHYFFSFPLSCHSLLCYFFLLSNFIFASFQVRFQGRSDVVCHPAFISLHGITKSRLTRLALASSTSTCAPKDMWGKHTNSHHVATVTFHFQHNLPLPHIPVGDVFYMHQLWLYVFGVHSCGDNRVSMYCYPETTAGSDEVISCLHHFFSELPPEVTSLRLCVLWWVCRSKQSNPLSVYSGVCRQI